MQSLRHILSRDWPLLMISLVLLIGGAVGLSLPVMLDSYDRRGFQIECGNGYHARLQQAEAEDRAAMPAAGSPAAAAPLGGQTERCRSAIAHRRVLATPAAVVGFAMLIPGLVKWGRTGRAGPTAGGADSRWTVEHPDRAMHDAALLDRHARPHWDRPSDTTL